MGLKDLVFGKPYMTNPVACKSLIQNCDVCKDLTDVPNCMRTGEPIYIAAGRKR